jgi:phosphoenolpyruvate carboxylase
VNIIPLFETIGDLRNSPRIMDRLFTIPIWRVLLDARSTLRK